jgi:putative transposase
MSQFTPTDRTQVKRLPKRGRYDRETVYKILDTAFVCHVSLSHPFVERLIGTLRREYLDHTLFWTMADLENKLLEFRTYFNNDRTHQSLEGRTPETLVSRPIANLRSFRWQPHCRSSYQTPMAA